MDNKVTLKNISQMLNISISTVSRALKNHPDISDLTKKRVKEAAEMLDYEPNAFAINLRTNKRNLIGVIVPFINNFFYQSFISAVEEEAKKNDYSLLILQSSDNPETENENLRICRSNRVAAVFVSISPQTTDISQFLKFGQGGTPVIFFDKVPAYEACEKVCVADDQAATLAAEILLKNKYKKILGVFGNPKLSITQKRLNAFVEFIVAHPDQQSPEIIYASSGTEARLKMEKRFRQKKLPDAIFCMSDEILMGVIKVIQILKLKVPGDVALVSISNDGTIPTMFEPEITYVETSGYELGKLAFKRMKDYMNGKTFVQQLVLPAVLRKGGSV